MCMASTEDRSWDSEPSAEADEEHPLHPFLPPCCGVAILWLESAAAVLAVNVCIC